LQKRVLGKAKQDKRKIKVSVGEGAVLPEDHATVDSINEGLYRRSKNGFTTLTTVNTKYGTNSQGRGG